VGRKISHEGTTRRRPTPSPLPTVRRRGANAKFLGDPTEVNPLAPQLCLAHGLDLGERTQRVIRAGHGEVIALPHPNPTPNASEGGIDQSTVRQRCGTTNRS